MHQQHCRAWGWVLASLLAAASPALADKVIVSSLSSQIAYDNVKITEIKDGELYFRTSSNELHKPLKEIARIEIADEPALGAAEDAYRSLKYSEAAESYGKTLRATNKPWLKDYASMRLIEAAGKANQFDLVIEGYVPLILKDPKLASSVQLTFPAADSAFLPSALVRVKAAYRDTLPKDQKLALLDLWIRLGEARNDNATIEEATRLLAAADPNDPRVKQGEERRLVLAIQDLLKAKQYDKVIEAVRRDTDKFVTPDLQAEALYCFAEARAGKASKDDEFRDAAMEFMRVAATYPADSPRVPDALLRTAEILAQLKDPKGALTVYRKVAADYRNQPAGQKAAAAIAKLEGK